MGRSAPYAQTRPFTVQEVDLDEPDTGQALVRIGAAGLCHSDLSVVNGSRRWPMPMVLGHEAAGVVERVGPDVGYVQPGDQVVFAFVPSCGQCVSCQSGRPAMCEPGIGANRAGTLLSGSRPFHRDGRPLHSHLGVSGFAERTVASVASMVRVPPDLPADKAALFGCALLTGIGAVVNTARAEPGSSVAVFGLGGVGLSVVMGARLAGCYPVIAVDRIESKLALAERAGASHCILADDASAAVPQITGGGADYAFEAVGDARVLHAAYAATRRGGTTVAVGLPHPEQLLQLPAASLVAEERRLVGCYMGSAVPRRDVPRFIDLYRAGLLPVDILQSTTIRLDDVNAGFDALASGEVVRQILIP